MTTKRKRYAIAATVYEFIIRLSIEITVIAILEREWCWLWIHKGFSNLAKMIDKIIVITVLLNCLLDLLVSLENLDCR